MSAADKQADKYAVAADKAKARARAKAEAKAQSKSMLEDSKAKRREPYMMTPLETLKYEEEREVRATVHPSRGSAPARGVPWGVGTRHYWPI